MLGGDAVRQAVEGAVVELELIAVLGVGAPEEGERAAVDPGAVAGRDAIEEAADLVGEHVQAVVGGEVVERWALGQDHGVHVGVEEEADGGRTEAGREQPLARFDHRLEAVQGPGGGVAPVDGQGDVDASRGHVGELALVPADAAPVQGRARLAGVARGPDRRGWLRRTSSSSRS